MSHHLDEASSWDDPSVMFVPVASKAPGSQNTGSRAEDQPERVDCIQATEMCNQNPSCSSRYRVMRQCLVGKEKEAMLDNNRDCQAALEVLLGSPLYDCRCKRSMKNELQCLQNYWAIHMGLNEGREQMVSQPQNIKKKKKKKKDHCISNPSYSPADPFQNLHTAEIKSHFVHIFACKLIMNNQRPLCRLAGAFPSHHYHRQNTSMHCSATHVPGGTHAQQHTYIIHC